MNSKSPKRPILLTPSRNFSGLLIRVSTSLFVAAMLRSRMAVTAASPSPSSTFVSILKAHTHPNEGMSTEYGMTVLKLVLSVQ
ncbi:hypothetical protein PsorP6_016776 [Peronosclerospora sorghi]|uniref:Uncharacterized protein n=1 Tax=Peronosclerospora sorghi TaxID=230839 RepID=A0ACC0WEM9_9STRA|nr:hypothetical protein PsorP6_016776 [Peronosclerospora sorghi]